MKNLADFAYRAMVLSAVQAHYEMHSSVEFRSSYKYNYQALSVH